MCGFFYSSNINFNIDSVNLNDLIPRGPDENHSLENDFGYFYHCRLITSPTNIKQPASNQSGILLYNGTEYMLASNDTDHILNNLSDNIDSNYEFLKSLNGDFSVCFVTDKHIFLARDCFGTKPLFYGKTENSIVVSSTFHAIESINIKPILVPINTLLVLDRVTYEIVKNVAIVDWDLTQGKTTLDDIFLEFENSVLTKFNDDTLLGLSSGYDSGAIAACLNKNSKDYTIAVWPHVENKAVLEQRIAMHKGKMITLTPEKSKKFRILWYKFLCIDGPLSDVAIETAEKAKNNNSRIILTGTGADELYSDYGFNGQKITFNSKFGGLFTENLEDIWPWHTNPSYPLRVDLPIVEYVNGLFGIDSRHPLLDRKLFQTWLNSDVSIKNKDYKYWMEQYLRNENYPFYREKISVSFPIIKVIN